MAGRVRVAICPCGCRWFGVGTEPPEADYDGYPVHFFETLPEAVEFALGLKPTVSEEER